MTEPLDLSRLTTTATVADVKKAKQVIKDHITDLFKSVDLEDFENRGFDAKVAALIGWEDLTYNKASEQWEGLYDYSREKVPSFMQSVDAAILVVPKLWVESYYKSFDGVTTAKCYPRGDLRLQEVTHQSDHTSVAILGVALQAHLAMIDR